MKKLIFILMTICLVGCNNNELRKYEQQTFNYLNANFLDEQPPDTYTYKHLRSYVEDGNAIVVIEMRVSTIRWTPSGMFPTSQSWEQVFTYEMGDK